MRTEFILCHSDLSVLPCHMTLLSVVLVPFDTTCGKYLVLLGMQGLPVLSLGHCSMRRELDNLDFL